MRVSQKQTFFGGAAILAAGVIVVKLIGALYKIPLYNLLDNDGVAYFSVAYNIYNLLLTVSTAGLPVALSKLVSESSALGRQNQVRRVFQVAFFTFFTLGLLSFLVMYFFAGELAAFMNNSQAVYAIRALSPAVLCVCCMSAFRGFAQGHSNMVPTVVSQIIEALCKLLIGLGLAWYCIGLGMGQPQVTAGAIFGVTIGAILSVLYLAVSHFRRWRADRRTSLDRPASRGALMGRLLSIAIPITLSSSAVSIITFVDTKIALGRLQTAVGLTEKMASDLYGIYQKAMTLYNLPAALMIPLTASIIPVVSAHLARRDRLSAGRIVESSLRTTGLLAFPCGVGLSVLSGPIMDLIYPDKTGGLVSSGFMLAVLGIAAIFVCVMLVSNAILQAHGFVSLPILTMLAGGFVKVAVNYYLVGNPDINIHGAAVGTLCCFGLVAFLNLFLLSRLLPTPLPYSRIFLKPALAAGGMGVVTWVVYALAATLFGNTLSTIAAIVAGGLAYLVLVVLLKAISREELRLMPKGDKIARILRIK